MCWSNDLCAAFLDDRMFDASSRKGVVCWSTDFCISSARSNSLTGFMLSCSQRRILKKFGKHNVIPKPSHDPISLGLKKARSVILTLCDFAGPVAAAYAGGWGADSTTPRLSQKTELLCLTATIVLDSNGPGCDRKPSRIILSTATNPAIGSDKTCNCGPSDYARC